MFLVQAGKQVDKPLRVILVEGPGGLIGQKQGRTVDEGAGNRRPLTLTARNLTWAVALAVRQALPEEPPSAPDSPVRYACKAALSCSQERYRREEMVGERRNQLDRCSADSAESFPQLIFAHSHLSFGGGVEGPNCFEQGAPTGSEGPTIAEEPC